MANSSNGLFTHSHVVTRSRLFLGIAVLTVLSIVAWWGYFDYGIRRYRKGDYAVAHTIFKHCSMLGNKRADFKLGEMYERGRGVNADKVQAAKYYLVSAHGGNESAQLVAGALYCNGDGVPANKDEGIRWYKIAAANGNKMAQMMVTQLSGNIPSAFSASTAK